MRSHTVLDIFKLDRDVPKTIMPGKTADISQFCETGLYEWVEFFSATVSFHDDLLVLEKYLGQSIDVGPAMTAKILNPTGKVVNHSTCRPHTPEEFADPVENTA